MARTEPFLENRKSSVLNAMVTMIKDFDSKSETQSLSTPRFTESLATLKEKSFLIWPQSRNQGAL